MIPPACNCCTAIAPNGWIELELTHGFPIQRIIIKGRIDGSFKIHVLRKMTAFKLKMLLYILAALHVSYIFSQS